MMLEHFRYDPIGLPLFSLTNKAQVKKSIQASYIDYAFRAFYLTMQDIEQLEMTRGDLVPDGRNSIVAVTFWFLGLESYINTLLKLTCFHENDNFNKYKIKSLTEKFSALFTLLRLDSLPVKKSGVHNRLHEFTVFRNDVFHDRNVGQPIKFNKTSFSEIPINCNLVDVIQGLFIFLEITSLLRRCISGLDTMPDIMIHVKNKMFSKKLDILFGNLIKPSFEAVLAKHKLQTSLNLNGRFPESLESIIFNRNEVNATIIVDSPSQYYFQLNSDQTSICSDLLLKIVDAENISSEHFGLGKYDIADD